MFLEDDAAEERRHESGTDDGLCGCSHHLHHLAIVPCAVTTPNYIPGDETSVPRAMPEGRADRELENHRATAGASSTVGGTI
jgi:hypothetical protein